MIDLIGFARIIVNPIADSVAVRHNIIIEVITPSKSSNINELSKNKIDIPIKNNSKLNNINILFLLFFNIPNNPTITINFPIIPTIFLSIFPLYPTTNTQLMCIVYI